MPAWVSMRSRAAVSGTWSRRLKWPWDRSRRSTSGRGCPVQNVALLAAFDYDTADGDNEHTGVDSYSR
jgi:hypothetical protein